MIFFFKLLYLSWLRYLKGIGLNPVITLAILLLLFVLASIKIYSLEYGYSLYLMWALTILAKGSTVKRNNFLYLNYSNGLFYLLRMVENLIVISPFVIFYLVQNEILKSMSLILVAFAMVLLRSRSVKSIVILQPFSKYDYEWIAAFRKYFLLPIPFLIGYCMGIIVHNYSLSLVCGGVLMLNLALPFQETIEKPVFIWQYKLSAVSFLKEKAKRIFNYSLCFIGFFLLIIAFNPGKWLSILFVCFWCLLTVIVSLITKYSRYPSSTSSVNQSLLVGASLAALFQPYLIPVVLFLAYSQLNNSIRSLKAILDDQY